MSCVDIYFVANVARIDKKHVSPFLVISRHSEQFVLTECGLGSIVRKAEAKAIITLEIRNEQTTFKNPTVEFEINKELDETTTDGRKFVSSAALNDEGLLIQIQRYLEDSHKNSTITRYMEDDDTLVIIYECGGVTAKKTYRRIKDDFFILTAPPLRPAVSRNGPLLGYIFLLSKKSSQLQSAPQKVNVGNYRNPALNFNVFPTIECPKIPEEYGIKCDEFVCYCQDPNKQFYMKDESFVYLGCKGVEKQWNTITPFSIMQSITFDIMDLAGSCQVNEFVRGACMCDMPSVRKGKRQGEKLCGAKKVQFWVNSNSRDIYKELTCTDDGWTSEGVVVHPEISRPFAKINSRNCKEREQTKHIYHRSKCPSSIGIVCILGSAFSSRRRSLTVRFVRNVDIRKNCFPAFDLVSGICFNELLPLSTRSPRKIVIPTLIVANHDSCKKTCWHLVCIMHTERDTCLVYSYADTKCLLLGEEITGAVVTVTNKEVVGVKCQDIAHPSICGGVPDTMTCSDVQCYCLDAKQIVVTAGKTKFSGSIITCDKASKQWQMVGPTDESASFLFPGSRACQSIAPLSYPACMCPIPFTMNSVRDGDKLCGNKPVEVWFAVGAGNNTPRKSPLTCTEKGWVSEGKVVKPQKIFCKK
ncbi:hypothetical protein PRIPAC_88732 [Pristionchus pacificus]|uniref:Uncharacterized protein n=1 Tax=Pristionchus pacificus TaxID=54126 RepID=A0A2A6CX86_PRIPA|nr:hypothetical protein PRIPAC_88732 [Pristionchus pacificus]|eukprot:PDM82748.1 hypothetical protein PRIPAC_37141 [Pristionchus pacificus]